jgi:uncharacterized iron-regulated membrane protein
VFFLFQQPQQPIVVTVEPQPAVTPPVSYGGMLMSALGLVGVILLAAFVVGVIIGVVIIWRKRREDAVAPPNDPGHRRLRS